MATSGLLAAITLTLMACSEGTGPDVTPPPASHVKAGADSEAGALIELPTLEVERPAPAQPEPRPANEFWGVTDPSPPVASPTASRFRLEIHALWFEGECSGEGKKSSAGISLVMRGRLTNPTGLRLHRATLTGAFFARFSDKTSLLKASRSLGFEDEVTSDALWEPGASRDFDLRTQPLDPVYCSYPALSALAGLQLEAEDPLGERIDETVHVQAVDWRAVEGAGRDLMATLATDTRTAGPFLGLRGRAGEAVRVVYVRRDEALVVGPEGAVGHVPLASLRADPTPISAEPRCQAKPAILRVGDLELTLDELRESPQGNLSGRAVIRNLAERPSRCGPLELRALMSNAKDVRVSFSPELLEACRIGIAPGGVASGAVTAMLAPGQEAIAIGLLRGPAAHLCETRAKRDAR